MPLFEKSFPAIPPMLNPLGLAGIASPIATLQRRLWMFVALASPPKNPHSNPVKLPLGKAIETFSKTRSWTLPSTWKKSPAP